MPGSKTEKFFVNRCDSIEGVILSHTRLIVEEILNYLDNSELLNCRRVCSFWKEIAESILSKRIIIINKYIPYQFARTAVVEPHLLHQLDFLRHQKFQYLVGFNQTQTVAARLVKNGNVYIYPRLNDKIKIQIAIFPSLPGIKVERFVLNEERARIRIDERITQLTQLINVPKDELKFLLYFISYDNLCYDNLDDTFPHLEVPWLLSTPINIRKFVSTGDCCYAFSGKRMNVVTFNIEDFELHSLGRIRLRKVIEKIDDYKLLPFRCLALMFISPNILREKEILIVYYFKNKFPNLPVLLFTDRYVFDLTTHDKTTKEQVLHRCLTYRDVSARIVLISLN